MKNKITFFIGLTLLTLTPQNLWAQSTETTQTALGEVSNFGEFISLVWNFGSQALLALAVFFVILGALFYVGSGGEERRIEQGKQMIIGSFIGIALVLLSGVLIRTLHKPAEGSTGALNDIPNVINNASTLLISIIGVFSVIMLIYAGLLTVFANGDAEKIQKANRALRYAVYGLVIGLSAYGLVRAAIIYLI